MTTRQQFSEWAHCVVERERDGTFCAVVSGLGRNRGTLDSSHSKSAAQKHAARLRVKYPAKVYTVEGMIAL